MATSTTQAKRRSYSHLLLPLYEQKNKLLTYDEKYWGGKFKERIEALDTESTHVQGVDDLEIFHVDFGSPKRDVEMWWKVIADTQPKSWRYKYLQFDSSHCRLAINTKQYALGIHRVRINLVAHHEPVHGRSVNEIRALASSRGEMLAHSEVLSALGLHDALLREQDGKGMPYIDIAGFEVDVSGVPGPQVMYVNWNTHSRVVDLSVHWAGEQSYNWAAPTLKC